LEKTIKRRNLVFVAILISLSVACSPTPKQEGSASSRFEVGKIEASKREVKKDKWGFPRELNYSFTACITDLVTDELVKGQAFAILGKKSVVKQVDTDSDGCIHWNESIRIDFLSGEKVFELDRRIEGKGLVRGSVHTPLSINPWRDYFSEGSSNEVVRDLRHHVQTASPTQVFSYDDFLIQTQKAQTQSVSSSRSRLMVTAPLSLSVDSQQISQPSSHLVGELRGQISILFTDMLGKTHTLPVVPSVALSADMVLTQTESEKVLSRQPSARAIVEDSRIRIPVQWPVSTFNFSTSQVLTLSLQEEPITSQGLTFSGQFIHNGQRLSQSAVFYPLTSSHKAARVESRTANSLVPLKASQFTTSISDIVEERRDYIKMNMLFKSCLLRDDDSKEPFRQSLDFFVVTSNGDRKKETLDSATGCFDVLIPATYYPNISFSAQDLTVQLQTESGEVIEEIAFECAVTPDVQVPCFDKRVTPESIYRHRNYNDPYMVVESLDVSYGGKEEWEISDSLHLFHSRDYVLDLDLAYIPSFSPTKVQDYPPIRNGKYKVTVSFLRAYSTELDWDGERAQEEQQEVYLTSDQMIVESVNGHITTPFRVTLRDLKLLKARGLLAIDISPVDSIEGKGLRPQRFLATALLDKNTVKIVIRAPQHNEYYRWLHSAYLPLLQSEPHELFELAKKEKAEFVEKTNRVSSPENYAKANQLKLVELGEDSGDKPSVLNQVFDSVYKGPSLTRGELETLCRYWAESLFEDSVNPEHNTDEFRTKLGFLCRLKIYPNHHYYLSQTPAPEELVGAMLRVRPKWMNLSVTDGQKAVGGQGNTTVYMVGAQFTASRVASVSSGTDGRVFGSASLGLFGKFGSIGVGGSYAKFWIDQDEKRKARESVATSVFYLAEESRAATFKTSRIRPCLTIRIRPQFLHQLMEQATYRMWSDPAPWKVRDQGLLICRPTVDLSKPVELHDSYYFISQIFRPDVFLDAYDLENQPWLLTIRGRSQFEDFRNFLVMKPDNNRTMTRADLDPVEIMKTAYDRYQNLELPSYPGVYVPSQGDIERLFAR
jgi:hypothetical protein